MFAPPLYKVRKVPFKYICDNNFNITEDKDFENNFLINQQDNMLFRQIRLITGNYDKYNPYIIFTDCNGSNSREKEFETLIKDGFTCREQKVRIGECSASMTRGGMLSFVDESIEEDLVERVTLGLDIGETVLDKWYAYRGLMLSSCHCIEDWIPKIVIVPDYYRTINNQNIKYVIDKETDFIDKSGNKRKWKQKDIVQGVKDIEINVFDGCGFHHPKITEFVKTYLKSETSPTSILWRAPFIKGVTHELNYVDFYKEMGIDCIVDIWGKKHSVSEDSEPMIVMCESMYKGYKYFQKYGDFRDWVDYWDRFKKYQHCIGVAKWNFTKEEEQVYTRSNYQILQDLDLPYEDFALLAKDSVDWIEKIINGDKLYTYCFLGLFADKSKAINQYTKSILKNPEMLKEYNVRSYLISLVKKYKDEMKCGKLWIKSCFKFLAPDLIMLMEWAGGIKNPNGALGNKDFFTFGIGGVYSGSYLIERNPHICRSEHVLLNAVTNDLMEKYCSHLDNVCIINGKSITPQRLNGADFD